jgi:hypothetical protein
MWAFQRGNYKIRKTKVQSVSEWPMTGAAQTNGRLRFGSVCHHHHATPFYYIVFVALQKGLLAALFDH